MFCWKPYIRLLLLCTGNRRENVVVEVRVVGRHAELFTEFGTRNEFRDSFCSHPWFLVRLRINNGHLGLQRFKIHTAVALDDAHLVTVNPTSIRTACIKPGSLIIADGFNDESITFPVAHIPAQPTRRWRIVRQFPAISPNRAEGVIEFKELDYPVPQRNEFESIVVC